MNKAVTDADVLQKHDIAFIAKQLVFPSSYESIEHLYRDAARQFREFFEIQGGVCWERASKISRVV